MKNKLLLFLLAGLVSCKPSTQTKTDVPEYPLPVVDVNAEYPLKALEANRLAEVIYIPLSKKSSKGKQDYYTSFLGTVSKDWIISYTHEGDVEIFDHAGVKQYSFNRMGSADEEYYYIFSLLWDEANREIWIADMFNRFKIYTLDGNFQRVVQYPDSLKIKIYEPYTADSLLCYDNYLVADGLNKNSYPFFLLSKTNGEVKTIESVRVSQRIDNSERLIVNLEGKQQVLNFVLSTSPFVVNGDRMVLADYAQDTIFYRQHETVYPLFARKPSVYASLPFILSSMEFMTSRYLFFSFVEKSQSRDRFYRDLLFDFATQSFFRYELLNTDFQPSLALFTNMVYGNYPSGWLVNEMGAERFLKYHREGKLKGKAAEVAEKMKGTDTCVLILYKFHE